MTYLQQKCSSPILRYVPITSSKLQAVLPTSKAPCLERSSVFPLHRLPGKRWSACPARCPPPCKGPFYILTGMETRYTHPPAGHLQCPWREGWQLRAGSGLHRSTFNIPCPAAATTPLPAEA